MAITLVGSPVIGTATNGGDVTLTLPAGVAEGDLVVLVGGHPDRETKPVGPSTGGYTTAYANDTAAANFGVWHKRMGATPDATVTCLGSTWAQHGTAYGLYVLRGTDPTTPLDTAVAVAVGTTNSPPITTVAPGAWVIAAAGWDEVTGGDPPAGWGNVIQAQAIDTVRFNLGAVAQEVATATTVDPPAAWAVGNANALAVTVAIRPAGTGPSEQHESGGATATTTTAATGAGTSLEAAQGGGAVTATTAPTGAGTATETATGGAAATLAVTVTGGGTGSEEQPPEEQHETGGGAAALTVVSGGAGSATETASGGSSVLAYVYPLGAGAAAEAATGGGTAGVVVGATGGGLDPSSLRDLTFLGFDEHQRRIGYDEHQRTVTFAEYQRTITTTGDPMRLNRHAVTYYDPGPSTEPAVEASAWRASFDRGATWKQPTDTADGRPKWLVAGVEAEAGSATVITAAISPVLRVVDAPETLAEAGPRIYI